jgi:hypothetical protein
MLAASAHPDIGPKIFAEISRSGCGDETMVASGMSLRVETGAAECPQSSDQLGALREAGVPPSTARADALHGQ